MTGEGPNGAGPDARCGGEAGGQGGAPGVSSISRWNVVGMSQYADGGRITTKPYAAGGAYLHRTGDHCGPCRYRPTGRIGERACPFTTGHWAFVHRHRDVLAANHRTARAAAGLDRLSGLPELLAAERDRGADPP